MHGLGIITTWVMQLFVMSMMISNVLNNNHDHHEYLMGGGCNNPRNNMSHKWQLILLPYLVIEEFIFFIIRVS